MSKIAEALRKMNRKFCSAVVVAAGSSTRMGEDKLMMKIGDVPVLAMSLLALDRCGDVDEIVVVTQAEKIQQVAGLCKEYGVSKASKVVCGGGTRTESALAGVSETNKKAKLICIHDGARPFVTPDIVSDVLKAASQYKAAAPAIGVKDTVRILQNGEVAETPNRSEVFAMQTPQAFAADLIKAALSHAVKNRLTFTDDCAAAEAIGIKVHLTRGSEDNIKVTTPLDVSLMEAIAERRRAEGTL